MDRAGNRSERADGPAFRLLLASEASAAIIYRGTWKASASTSYMGGKARYTKSAGARATYSFTGRSVSWVTATGPTRGWAEVWVDGTFRATIRLYASTTTTRKAMYTRTWAAPGQHTIQVRVLGSPSSHPRVDVDSFVVIR